MCLPSKGETSPLPAGSIVYLSYLYTSINCTGFWIWDLGKMVYDKAKFEEVMKFKGEK